MRNQTELVDEILVNNLEIKKLDDRKYLINNGTTIFVNEKRVIEKHSSKSEAAELFYKENYEQIQMLMYQFEFFRVLQS
ncbi:MAG: hypothetical protein ACRCX8_07250 [Sarcina sp.]